MAFWKSKSKPQIPPPANDPPMRGSSPQPPPSYKSNSSIYNASRDGDLASKPYGGGAASGSMRDRYDRNAPVGDAYSRGGEKDVDADRAQLFSGYNPERRQNAGNRFEDDKPRGGGYDRYGQEQEQAGDDEDVEGIKKQTKFIKQESVNSTRNALRIAREAEETARNTLVKLGDQSEKIGSTERHLDVATGHTNRAMDATDELKQLNRSIFRPVITFNKDAKRQAQEAKLQQRYDDERDQREKAMADIAESHQRVGRAATYGVQSRDGPPGADDEETIGGPGGRGSRYKSPEVQKARSEQRKRYQFEATASDDELEDELDDNLDEIGEAAKRMKALAMATGEELTNQNERLKRIENKATKLDDRIVGTTTRLGKVGR